MTETANPQNDTNHKDLSGKPIDQLLQIMRVLRDPEVGCPWDIKQTFATIAPYTLEEAYEVVEAIALDSMPALKEELGDLLLQVVFHAQIAAEQKAFTFDDVAKAVSEKMIRRHPHVFGSAPRENFGPDAWEALKAQEKKQQTDQEQAPLLQTIKPNLPALMRALALQKEAAKTGFDWTQPEPILSKIIEECQEVSEVLYSGEPERRIEEIGDLLFAVVNLARHMKVEPETALRQANIKFARRYEAMLSHLRQQGLDPIEAPLDAMEDSWQAIKSQEKP